MTFLLDYYTFTYYYTTRPIFLSLSSSYSFAIVMPSRFLAR
jgi:hypothetical protein